MNLKLFSKVQEYKHFKIHSTLLELVGLWPPRDQLNQVIKQVVVILFMSIMTIPHIYAIEIWCGKNMIDFTMCTENIAGAIYFLGVLLRYILILLHDKDIYRMVTFMIEFWKSLKDINEKEIMIKLSELGLFRFYIYFGYVILTFVGFDQFILTPVFLDYIKPLNESRQKLLPIRAEFPFDPFEHYYKIYFSYSTVYIVVFLVLVSVEGLYISFVHQNVGIINIIKYRLKMATQSSTINQNESHTIIISAIELHNKSLEFTAQIKSTYDSTFFLSICGGVVLMCMTAQSIIENPVKSLECVRLSLVVIGCMVCLFYLNGCGQLIIDGSNELLLSIYMTDWYNVSQKEKVLIKIMMMRCAKQSYFTAGRFYIMSLENYKTIIKTTLSYIAVLSSFKH